MCTHRRGHIHVLSSCDPESDVAFCTAGIATIFTLRDTSPCVTPYITRVATCVATRAILSRNSVARLAVRSITFHTTHYATCSTKSYAELAVTHITIRVLNPHIARDTARCVSKCPNSSVSGFTVLSTGSFRLRFRKSAARSACSVSLSAGHTAVHATGLSASVPGRSGIWQYVYFRSPLQSLTWKGRWRLTEPQFCCLSYSRMVALKFAPASPVNKTL